MPRDLPIGNGTVLINFDSHYAMRDIFFPHVGQENHSIGHPSRFGVFIDDQFSWVGPEWQITMDYLEDTLVTNVRLFSEKLKLEITVHDAVDFHLWVYLRELKVKDLSGQNRKVKLYFTHDLHIGETQVGDTAFYDPRTNSVIHYKRDRWFLINLCTPTKCGVDEWACGTKEACGMEGTWKDAEDGSLSNNPIAQGSVDSTIGIGFDLEANSTAVAHYWICFGVSYDKVVKLNSIVLEKTPTALIERTADYWKLWVNAIPINFQNLPEAIIKLYKRSLLVIRSQIDQDGAIIAANDYDIAQFSRDTYSYMWPRDGAIVANALSRAGHRELCVRFFNFLNEIIGENGYFLHKYNPDKTLASSWHPWLRNGAYSLPIQEDETALVLWSLWEHFRHYRDVEVIKPLYRKIITNCADFMVDFRDERTKLPKPSYDLWEERYGIHLFTAASVVAGLLAGANFAHAFGDHELHSKYNKAAEEVKAAIEEYFLDGKTGTYARMLSIEGDKLIADLTADSACAGLFLFDAFRANEENVVNTMKRLEDTLAIPQPIWGIARYQNDYYQRVSTNFTGNPWFISTMWLAQFHARTAKNNDDLSEVIKTMQWVVERALPSGVLAEQVNPENGSPLSVSPLTWSHAGFVILVHDYLDKHKKLLSKSII